MPSNSFESIVRNSRGWILCCLTVVCWGCAGQAAKVELPAESSQTEKESHDGDEASDGSSTTDVSSTSPTTDVWSVIYLNDEKVGHSHFTITSLAGEHLPARLRLTMENDVTIKRAGQLTNQNMVFETTETVDGELVSFTDRSSSGAGAIHFTGQVDGDSLEINQRAKGKAETTYVDWDGTAGGFFAVEQSLRKQPMQPGETRRIKALQPRFYQVSEVTLTATEWEETEMLAGTQRLLRVESSMELRLGPQVQTVKQTMWTDHDGETLKTHDKSLGLTAYQTSKEIALREIDDLQFDLFEETTVSIDEPIPNAHQTNKVVYEAKLADNPIRGVFAAGLSQAVELLDEHTAKITVISIRPGQEESLSRKDVPPTDDERKPNSLIQSDNEQVIALAESVAVDESDTWELALALEQLVATKIANVDFSQAFLSAAEVAETLSGDCTEHAVLLAALCRAREIPARVAIGLVHFHGGFAYHMWTEVWIKDRWIPLDATLGEGGIGAAHLKLTHSNLKGATAYSAFLPVISVIGRLKLNVLEVN